MVPLTEEKIFFAKSVCIRKRIRKRKCCSGPREDGDEEEEEEQKFNLKL